MYGHLVRRGLEAASEHLSHDNTRDWQALHDRYQMPAWGMVLLGSTTVAFVLFAMALEYTIRLLIVHLAIVETPANAVVKVYRPVVECDGKKDVVDIEVEETHVVSDKPLTSSIKRTMKHITSLGGFSNRWRGLPIFLVYTMIISVFHMLAVSLCGRAGVGTAVASFIADMSAALMTARIHCAWTHATITTGYKRYYERVINRVQWKELLPAVALKVVGNYVFVIATLVSAGAVSPLMMRETSLGIRAAIALIPITTALSMSLLVVLPVNIMLVRKEASMLAESEETAVPFDRTFGNRIIPGLNSLKLRDNWAGISRDTLYRVAMLHIKWIGIASVIAIVYFQVALLEMWAIMGEALPAMLSAAKAHLQGMA